MRTALALCLVVLSFATTACQKESVAEAQAEAEAAPSPPRAACQARLARGVARPRSVGARIGTWNVRWFPFGRSRRSVGDGTDLGWLACSIAVLDLDVVAVQEFVQSLEGRRATADLLARLQEATGATWHASFDTCPDDGRQHVGFLHREDRVSLEAPRTLGEINPAGGACAHQLRPGLMTRARFTNGTRLTLLTIHLDSGTTDRDRTNRGTSVAEIARIASAEADPDAPLVVLGDWNTMGCRSCDAPQDGAAELAEVEATLRSSRRALRRIAPDLPCSTYYRGRPAVLDHVFATGDLPRAATVQAAGACGAIRCGRLDAESRVAFDALSDHCPLVLEVPLATTGAARPRRPARR